MAKAEKIITSIDELKKLVAAAQDYYVRWSRGHDFDKTMQFSRDYASGGAHGGLSSVKVEPDWVGDDKRLANRITEYRFLRMKDPEIGAHIYQGSRIGADSDGYDLITNTSPVATLSEDLITQLLSIKNGEAVLSKKPIGSASESGSALPSLLYPAAATLGGAMFAAPYLQEAHNALNNFQSRRAAKRDYWRQMRQEITDFASAVAGGAFAALDKPLQGYMGLAGVAGTLAAGGTLPQALQQGARIAAQPSEATAYQYGGAMTDALAPYSPQGAAIAGALTNAGIQLTSPF